ncbi:MAG: hypothetical protein GF364_13040 [Candidatus Lokiarchaeota archaeon]|nr:hypothetical protein [Candidatus Lokiarchaeota archaeon]
MKKSNKRANGYRGIWYYNQPSHDEYVYKYSGGLATYCAKHIPMAWYSKESKKTFFCYGGRKRYRNRLLHMVSYFDHETGTVPRPTILLDKKTSDAHDNPTMLIDKDGYIWIFSSSHGTSRPSYIHKSSKPFRVDSFSKIIKTNFSYPQCMYLSDYGFLFLHTKYMNHHRVLSFMRSKNGLKWSDRKLLSHIEKGHYQVTSFHRNKVGTAFNFHPEPGGLNYRTNLYYIETNDFGDTWCNVSGDRLKLPLNSVQNPALIHDYAKENMLVYMKDINFDRQGNPIILYVLSKGYESGPENNPRIWKTAHWNDSTWDISGDITSDSNYDTGCIHIEEDGKWRIIGPTEVGPQPFNPGGEICMWISENNGKRWENIHQMTKNSMYNNTYVRRPMNAKAEFYAFWADGNPRKRSESHLYFCNKAGDKVHKLPSKMRDNSRFHI